MSNGHATNEQAEQLEKLLDTMGLHNMLGAIAIICGEKAEHIETVWQDRKLAKKWNAACHGIGRLHDWARKIGPA